MMKWRLVVWFLGLLAGVGTAVSAGHSPALLVEQLIINEVDYDQPGPQDVEEFIEITNIGNSAANLAQYQVELVNGAGGVYRTISLNAASLPPGEYFVLCRNQALVLNCNQEYTGSINDGGPGAVALLTGPVLVDTVSYEGNTAAPYTEGSGVGLEDDGTAVMRGIARWPNAEDTNTNNVDFSGRCVTPGLPNVAQDSDCASLFDPAIAVTLTAVPATVPEPGGAVTLTVRVDNEGLLPVTLQSLTDNEAQDLDGQGSCQTGQSMAAGDFYTCDYAVMISGVEDEQIVRTVTAVAADQFSNEANNTGQTAVSITQRLRWDVYLPAVLRPLPYGEPNNTCTQAVSLPLNQSQAFLAEDGHDWYVFELAQSGTVRIYWQNFVSQEGQMILYRGSCDDLVFIANNGETAVNRTLDAGSQPAGRYFIWLINDGPLNDQDEYTLRVQFP